MPEMCWSSDQYLMGQLLDEYWAAVFVGGTCHVLGNMSHLCVFVRMLMMGIM